MIYLQYAFAVCWPFFVVFAIVFPFYFWFEMIPKWRAKFKK
jgi:hypothetical protein